jgi:hypothetical protein
LQEQSVIDIDDYRERLMAGSQRSQSPEAETMRAQIAKLLERAVANLPDALRPVFMLREIEGLSVDETAEALQIPTATVKTRLLRSRRRLQRELDPEIREALRDTFPFAGRDCDALTKRVLANFLLGWSRIRETINVGTSGWCSFYRSASGSRWRLDSQGEVSTRNRSLEHLHGVGFWGNKPSPRAK